MRSTGGATAVFDVRVDVPLVDLDDDAVLDLVREVERARRQLDALDHRLVVELEVRSVAARRLQRGTAGLLSAVLHLDRSETRRRVAAAAELGPRTRADGTPLVPELPATAAALAVGSLSAHHARVVSRTVARLPRSLPPEVVVEAEGQLAEQAAHLLPAELAQVGERLVAHLDPDGSLTDDADRARRRGVVLGRQGDDGLSPVSGLLTPGARALLDAALGAVARPETRDGVRDPRTPAQRNHDGLAALAEVALASGRVGSARGAPATVVVTMDVADLEDRVGRATTATGGTLSIPEALDLAADASWVLLLVDHDGQPLWLSRTRRLATRGQRQALLVRDGGCTRPGCDVPAAWCEAHHLVEWQAGGTTDVDDLALVCPFDHHLVTAEGYTVGLGEHGRTTWTAPRWLDPEQVPRVNGVHRPVPPGPDPTHVRRPRPRARQRSLARLASLGPVPASSRPGVAPGPESVPHGAVPLRRGVWRLPREPVRAGPRTWGAPHPAARPAPAAGARPG